MPSVLSLKEEISMIPVYNKDELADVLKKNYTKFCHEYKDNMYKEYKEDGIKVFVEVNRGMISYDRWIG